MIRRIIGLVSISFLYLGCASQAPTSMPDTLEVKTIQVSPKEMQTPVVAVLPTITGLWKSVTPEPAGNGHFRIREYSINLSRWELTTTLFADKELKKTILVYRAEGPYTLENQSKKVPGAFEANFRVNRKTLTYKHKDSGLMKELGLKSCQLVMGKELDITRAGCGEFKAASDCGQEFDLVKMENGNLRLGDRPQDNEMCSIDERPESLGPALRKLN